MSKFLDKILAKLGLGKIPDNHPPINWSNWSPPRKGDVRSPCPGINALANHNILPHDGKNITKAMAVEALTRAYNLDPLIATVFSSVGVAANPDHRANSFDLNHVNKHNYIEHDGSLSRDDAAFGSNSDFNKEKFDEVFRTYQAGNTTGAGAAEEGIPTVNWHSASNARYARIMSSKARHEAEGKQFTYGLKQAVGSYGESALVLNLLGKDEVAPLEWVKIFFEEERLPYAEGWRPPPKLNQAMLNHTYLKMIEANEHKDEEARLIGLGTIEAMKASILSLGSSMMKAPSGEASPTASPLSSPVLS